METQEQSQNITSEVSGVTKKFQKHTEKQFCTHCKDGIIPEDEYICDTCGKAQMGGRRPNSGRALGSMGAKAYEQLKVREAFNQNVMRAATKLFNAQFGLAIGEQSLYVRKTVEEGGAKKSIIEIVTDEEIIKEFLVDDGDSINAESSGHYYLATKPANNMAIDSLLNRALGKAPDKLIIEGGFFKTEKMLIEIVQPDENITEGEIVEDGTSNTDTPSED